MTRTGIWAGTSSRAAVKIGDHYNVTSLGMTHGGLLDVQGTYSGKVGFVYLGDDPINLYLYRRGKLQGYGPAYIDAQFTLGPYPHVMGQFRASSAWHKLPTLS